MLHVDLTLIWVLIKPFEQGAESTLVPKGFDGSSGVPWESWANLQREVEEAAPHVTLLKQLWSLQKQGQRARRGFSLAVPARLTAVSTNHAPANQPVHAPCWKGACRRQPVPLGKAGRLGAELPWEQHGCMTPTPWHPRARHTAFNHPLTCASPYSVHLPEETLVWSARTYYTWCQNKCNLFWKIWGSLLPTCQTKSQHWLICV